MLDNPFYVGIVLLINFVIFGVVVTLLFRYLFFFKTDSNNIYFYYYPFGKSWLMFWRSGTWYINPGRNIFLPWPIYSIRRNNSGVPLSIKAVDNYVELNIEVESKKSNNVYDLRVKVEYKVNFSDKQNASANCEKLADMLPLDENEDFTEHILKIVEREYRNISKVGNGTFITFNTQSENRGKCYEITSIAVDTNNSWKKQLISKLDNHKFD